MSTVRIQVRRGTAADWTSVNPVLASGEMGVESDTNKFKFGNGSSQWNSLGYAAADTPAIEEISQDAINNALSMGSGLTKSYNDGSNTITISVDSDVIALKSYVDNALTDLGNTSDSTYIPQSDRGAALGVASLDGNGKIPTSEIDTTVIATQADILAMQAGLTVKAAVEASTVSNLSATYSNGTNGVGATLTMSSNGALTIDGVGPLGSGARVLVKNQTDAKQNGVYTVTTVGGSSSAAVLTRASDFDGSPENEILPGMFTFTREGTANARDGYILLAGGSGTNGAFVLGTDNLEFTQFTGATPITTGFGLSIINDEISVNSGEVKTVASFDTFKTANDLALDALTNTTGDLANQDTILSGRIDDVVNVNSTQSADISTLNGQVADLAEDKADTTYVDQADTELQSSIDTLTSEKAPIASPTFTGTVTIPGGASIEGYAHLANPTFTGTVTLPNTTSIGDVSSTEIAYVNGVTSGIQTQLDSKATSAALSSHESDTTNIHGITDTADLATKLYADGKASDAQTAAIAYADALTTSDIAEGSSLYFTDERAQDAVGNAVGNGLTYTDASGAIAVDTTTIQARVANVSDTEIGYLDGVTSSIQTQIDSKAPTDNPTFTGTVSGVTKSMVGLGNVDNTSDANKPVSTATQTALDAKASLSGATFTGAVSGTSLTLSGNLTVNGTTTTVNTTNFTTSDPVIYLGDGNNANSVDLGFVASYNDGTYAHQGLVKDSSDSKWKLFKGVTDEPTTTVNFAQGSLDALAVGAFEASSATIGDVSNTELQYLNGVTSAVQTQLDAKAPLANPTFTGTVSGVTKSMVGLGNVDNTSDANKPVSTATQTALDLKAPKADPTFTGTVTVASAGIAFTDGTQSKMGVQSLTPIKTAVAANTTLDALGTDANTRDTLVPISGAYSVTFDTTGNAKYAIGASIDFYQSSGTGATFVQGSGMTLQYTPGLALRTTYSSATAIKVAATTWLIYGDLKA